MKNLKLKRFMTYHKSGLMKRAASLLLIFSVLLSLIHIPAYAAEGEPGTGGLSRSVQVRTGEDTRAVIGLIEDNGKIYINSRDIESIKGSKFFDGGSRCGYAVKHGEDSQILTILGYLDPEDILRRDGQVYTEISASAAMNGMVFSRDKDGALSLSTLRTLPEFRDRIYSVYTDADYRIGMDYMISNYAKPVAIFSSSYLNIKKAFSNIFSLFGTVSGHSERDLMMSVLIDVLKNDSFLDQLSDSIDDGGEFIGDISKTSVLLKKTAEDENFVRDLCDMGMSRESAEKIRGEILSSYAEGLLTDDIAAIADGYDEIKDVAEPVIEVIKTCSKIVNVVRADALLVTALDEIYSDSSPEPCAGESMRSTAEELTDLYKEKIGVGITFLLDEMMDYTLDELGKDLTKVIRDLINDGSKLKSLNTRISLLIWDLTDTYLVDLEDLCKADMKAYYLSLMQVDAESYFHSHLNSEGAGEKLQACTLLFVKTYIELLDTGFFDHLGKNKIAECRQMALEDMVEILSYSKEELSGAYGSRELYNNLRADMQSRADAQGRDYYSLFDESCWLFSFGSTLGSNPSCVFHRDGTADGSNGITYRWEIVSGSLFIDGLEYVDNPQVPGGFRSREKQHSGYGGYDGDMYYTLSPCTQAPQQSPVWSAENVDEAILSDYALMLSFGVMLETDCCSFPASHYALLDMNSDSIPELIAFGVYQGMAGFKIFTYTDVPEPVANSLGYTPFTDASDCDLGLALKDNKTVLVHAAEGGSCRDISINYDGISLSKKDSGSGLYNGAGLVRLITDGSISGGTEIRSSGDPLSMYYPPSSYTGESCPGLDETFENGVVKPEEGEWLDRPELHTVQSEGGVCIYLRYGPSTDYEHFDTVNEQELVTVEAVENGFSLAVTSDGRRGWCKSRLLSFYGYADEFSQEQGTEDVWDYREVIAGENTPDGSYYGSLYYWNETEVALYMKEKLPPVPGCEHINLQDTDEYWVIDLSSAVIRLDEGFGGYVFDNFEDALFAPLDGWDGRDFDDIYCHEGIIRVTFSGGRAQELVLMAAP